MKSRVHASAALPNSALPAESTTPEPAAARAKTYFPSVPVIPARFPKVQVMLSVVVSVCAVVSRLTPPSRLRVRSLRSKLAIGSLNVIVIESTALVRGSGATGAIVGSGGVVWVVHETTAPAERGLPAESTMPVPEPAKVRT